MHFLRTTCEGAARKKNHEHAVCKHKNMNGVQFCRKVAGIITKSECVKESGLQRMHADNKIFLERLVGPKRAYCCVPSTETRKNCFQRRVHTQCHFYNNYCTHVANILRCIFNALKSNLNRAQQLIHKFQSSIYKTEWDQPEVTKKSTLNKTRSWCVCVCVCVAVVCINVPTVCCCCCRFPKVMSSNWKIRKRDWCTTWCECLEKNSY